MNPPPAVAWALAVLAGTASLATAGPLLSPARDARAALGLPGVPHVQRLALDRDALAALRAQTTATVVDFPLGPARRAALELRRTDPFGQDARLVVVEDGGRVRALAAPDRAWFIGGVRGEPGSRALVVAGPDRVHGFVVSGGDVFPFGPDAAGHHRTYALSAADAAALRPPDQFCLQDVYGPTLEALRPALAAPAPQTPVARAASGALLGVDLALETDQELRAKLGSDDATLDYLGSLVAAANLIYERDTALRLRASFVRVWAGADPWTGSSPLDALYEVRDHWTNPANRMAQIAGPRDAVQFVSGKPVQGGVAWLAAVCSPDVGYAVSQVSGAFDTASPQQIWDVLVFTHELGHTLGSPHTHCYDPPIDTCYAGEAGCYAGPERATSSGTLMSYCHLQPGGLANVRLLFGDRPSGVIRAAAEEAACLTPVADAPVCGNGTVESGEACDDGNTAPGDGCDGACRPEGSCGDGVVAGNEQCDDGNATAGDGCSAACRAEVCGNGVADAGESCDDGNAADGDGCSARCAREPRCGDGTLDAGEACDDGNTSAGDGCSAACALEPCAVRIPHQAAWAAARLSWTRASRVDRLRLNARFGVPAAAGTPAVDAGGLRVLVAGADGGERVALDLPGGAGWTGSGASRRWRRAAGGGTVTAQIRDLGGASVRTVDVRVSASGRWSLGPDDVPLTVTVVLGGAPAGQAGLCGRHAYGAGTCSGRGRRIACR